MIPVSIVTGFLGSGKTTLIGRILRDPVVRAHRGHRQRVRRNRSGPRDLVAAATIPGADDRMPVLRGAERSDRDVAGVATTRRGLFDRVLIETSGLADPAPILQADDGRRLRDACDRYDGDGRRSGAWRGTLDRLPGGAAPGGARGSSGVQQDRSRRRPVDRCVRDYRGLNPSAPASDAAEMRPAITRVRGRRSDGARGAAGADRGSTCRVALVAARAAFRRELKRIRYDARGRCPLALTDGCRPDPNIRVGASLTVEGHCASREMPCGHLDRAWRAARFSATELLERRPLEGHMALTLCIAATCQRHCSAPDCWMRSRKKCDEEHAWCRSRASAACRCATRSESSRSARTLRETWYADAAD